MSKRKTRSSGKGSGIAARTSGKKMSVKTHSKNFTSGIRGTRF